MEEQLILMQKHIDKLDREIWWLYLILAAEVTFSVIQQLLW